MAFLLVFCVMVFAIFLIFPRVTKMLLDIYQIRRSQGGQMLKRFSLGGEKDG